MSAPILYGADGERLPPKAATLRDPAGRDERLKRNKATLEAWLKMATFGDAAAGRGDHNWSTPPKKCLRQKEVDAMRQRGMVVYVAPGQVIIADLTGQYPRVRQRRPLAERYVELVPETEAAGRA